MARMVGVGVLVGGLAAVVVALFLSTAPARSVGLPSWVWVTALALIVAGVGAVSARPWAVVLGLGAVLLGRWAMLATIADIETGLPGPAIPLLAAGCTAVLVAAVLLAVPPSAPWRRGSIVRQSLPAAIGLVMVAVFAGVTEVAALRWIPVDATTADRVDPAPVPDQPAGVRWTWPTPHPLRGVVAAGAGVLVAYDDRVVALDGPTGAERWHHRWDGANVLDLAATPDGRIAVARVRAGGSRPRSAVFAFDADTGEVRWSRQPGFRFLGATDHVLLRIEDDGTHVGADLGDGDDIWSWKPQADCELHWSRPSPDAVLSAQTCRGPAGDTSYGVIGVDDRSGAQRWRFASATTVVPVEYKPFLDISPDGRVAMFAFSSRSGKHKEPVLLESATGAVVYRADGDPDIVGPDLHTPVLRRTVSGAEPRLVIRELSTGTERPLASACSGSPAVTSRSVLGACFDWVENAPLRATVGVHSRPDGAPTASISVTDAVRGIPPSTIPPLVELVPAPGAIVLAVQNQPYKQPSIVVGLT